MSSPFVTVLNPAGSSNTVLVCEHASNHIPPEYRSLGLPGAELQRHIAWDIGARDLSVRLGALLDAPVVLSGISRLMIDCNRPPGVPSSIPERSEATEIPGNRGLDHAERTRREASYFWPFQNSVSDLLDRRRDAGRPTRVVGVHSFTPVFLGQARIWHAGVLYGAAAGFAQSLLARLRDGAAFEVGDNEPYKVSSESDYTIPVHGDGRGLDAVLFEIRQDLLAADGGVEAWAWRLAAALCDS